jgi:hypothetical protein
MPSSEPILIYLSLILFFIIKFDAVKSLQAFVGYASLFLLGFLFFVRVTCPDERGPSSFCRSSQILRADCLFLFKRCRLSTSWFVNFTGFLLRGLRAV